MNIIEFRKHPEYAYCIKKIKSYRKGFKFTLNYSQIPRAKADALRLVMQDAIVAGLVESVSVGVSFGCEVVSETFRKVTEATR